MSTPHSLQSLHLPNTSTSLGSVALHPITSELYFTDYRFHQVKKVLSLQESITVAGTVQGYKNGRCDEAQFSVPLSLCFDACCDLIVTEFSGRIRKISLSDGVVSTLVDDAEGAAYVCVDCEGVVYFTNSKRHVICCVGEDGICKVFARQKLKGPRGICIDWNGDFIVVNQDDKSVVRVFLDGTAEYIFNDTSLICSPHHVICDKENEILYVADLLGHKIVQLIDNKATPLALTVPESDIYRYPLNRPMAMAFDQCKNIIVIESSIRKIHLRLDPIFELYTKLQLDEKYKNLTIVLSDGEVAVEEFIFRSRLDLEQFDFKQLSKEEFSILSMFVYTDKISIELEEDSALSLIYKFNGFSNQYLINTYISALTDKYKRIMSTLNNREDGQYLSKVIEQTQIIPSESTYEQDFKKISSFEFSDITINVIDVWGEEREYNLHRKILHNQTQHFKDLLDLPFFEHQSPLSHKSFELMISLWYLNQSITDIEPIDSLLLVVWGSIYGTSNQQFNNCIKKQIAILNKLDELESEILIAELFDKYTREMVLETLIYLSNNIHNDLFIEQFEILCEKKF